MNRGAELSVLYTTKSKPVIIPTSTYYPQIFHDQMTSHEQYQQFSPPLSVASSSSSSSLSSSPPTKKLTNRPTKLHKLHLYSSSPPPTKKSTSAWNFTWLVFMNEKWVPFDTINQTRLEQTLTVGGTFVDIQDSHFPKVKRVRVFPRNNYLSYLGVKYRLSRIMQPDAYLDHVSVAEARKSSSKDYV